MSKMTAANCTTSGPQSALETKYIEEYLLDHGYHWSDLHDLSESEAKRLMTEACTYASFKLAEVESRAQFRQRIHMD